MLIRISVHYILCRNAIENHDSCQCMRLRKNSTFLNTMIAGKNKYAAQQAYLNNYYFITSIIIATNKNRSLLLLVSK